MAADATTIRNKFFMFVVSQTLSGGLRPENSQMRKSEKYTTVEMAKSLSWTGFRLLSSPPRLQFRASLHRCAIDPPTGLKTRATDH